jgi:hypothetical protein
MSRADDGAGAPSHGQPSHGQPSHSQPSHSRSSFGPVDLDRLADYAAGVLDPTAAAEVERHVRTDDRWARALEALQVADEAVRAKLHDLATSHPARMPADVAGRIEDALREIAPESSVISLATARTKRQVGHRRFVTGIMAAAATLVLVLCGITFVRGGPTQYNSGTSGGAPQAEQGDRGAAPPPPAAGDSGALADASVLVFSSGANYTPQALQNLIDPTGPRVALSTSAGEKVEPDAIREYSVPERVAQAAPSPLTRLTEKTALSACLAAIRVKYPGVPTLIDYARYEGRPALIVSVRADRSTTVVAVGGGCGVLGPDEIAAVTKP